MLVEACSFLDARRGALLPRRASRQRFIQIPAQARARCANSAKFVGEAAVEVLGASSPSLQRCHLAADAVGDEGMALSLERLSTGFWPRLRILQLVGAERALATAEMKGLKPFNHLGRAAPALEALELREMDLAAARAGDLAGEPQRSMV